MHSKLRVFIKKILLAEDSITSAMCKEKYLSKINRMNLITVVTKQILLFALKIFSNCILNILLFVTHTHNLVLKKLQFQSI